MPVVEVLPLVQLSLQVAASEVDRGPEFESVGLLRTLKLAKEMPGARADVSQRDPLMPQGLVQRKGEELTTAVCLDP
jgi:hypothetical protein